VEGSRANTTNQLQRIFGYLVRLSKKTAVVQRSRRSPEWTKLKHRGWCSDKRRPQKDYVSIKERSKKAMKRGRGSEGTAKRRREDVGREGGDSSVNCQTGKSSVGQRA